MRALRIRWATRMGPLAGLIPAVVMLCLMPVEYRAGAIAPHPHPIAQLIWEASNGTPRHHHVRATTHPCVLATRAASEPVAQHTLMAESDLAGATDTTRATSTLLAVTVMPWLLCLVRLGAAAGRHPFGPRTVPRGLTLTPDSPPPQAA